MASSPPQGDGGGAAGAVCCMCGDHGLPHELFRCRSCRVRLQHRYCSDLYPRATGYSRCNWCLREPAESGGGGRAHAHAAANKPTAKRKAAASTETSISDEEERQRHEAGCSTSRRAAAEIGRPVKKRKADERAPAPAPGAAKGSSGNRKLTQAGKMTRPVRIKVRRYKLLAEVISC